MTPAVATALVSQVLRPGILVEMDFLSGPLYIWSGMGTLNWNGDAFLGVGSFGSISIVEEGNTVQARGITLGLSGIDSSLLAGALQELSQELPVTVWMGLFDSSLALIPDPLVIWAGFTDQPTIAVSGETATISLNCESKLLSMNVPADRRLTQDDANLLNPGDLAFIFTSSIQQQNVYWGRVVTGTPAI